MRALRAVLPYLATGAGITAVVTLLGWPQLTGYALAVCVGAVAALRGPIPGQETAGAGGEQQAGQTDPAADPLTAEEARELAEDLSLQLYRAQDALQFVAEMCDIADEHRGVRGKPATVTTVRVREWLKGAQCARQAGLVLSPDGSGQPADPVRTDPDTTGQHGDDQGGHDPDALRTRLAAALHEDPHADWHYLTGRATEIREGRDRADAECNRLRRMGDEYSAGARSLSDKLRAARAECDAIEAVEAEASEPPTRDDMRLVISRFRRTITEEA